MKKTSLVGILVVLTVFAAGCASTGPSGSSSNKDDLDYHLLLAEIARERGQYTEAARHYAEAARLSDDPELAERATILSYESGLTDVGVSAGRRWLELGDEEDARVYRYLGALELRAGNSKASSRYFSELVERAPDVPSGMELMLGFLALERDRQTSTDVMKRIVRGYPDSAEAHYSLGRLALRSGDTDLALKSARRGIELRPGWPDGELLYARVLLVTGATELGLNRGKAVASEAENPQVRLEYAELLLAARKTEEARTLLNEILVDVPGLPEAVRALAFLELSAGNLPEARGHFDDLKLGQRYRTEALYYLGRIAETDEEYFKAVRLYSRVADGNYAVEAQLRASQLLYQRLNDPDGALAHLSNFAVANSRYETDMLVGRGRLLVQMGRTDEAMALLEAARAEEPDDEPLSQAHAELYLFTAQQAINSGELEEADRLLNAGLDLQPDSPTLRYSKALLLERTGKLRRAISILEDLVDESPDDALALNALGYTLADRTRRLDEARRYIQRALAIDPDNPAILDSMGWVLYRLGENEAALEFLNRARGLDPDPEIAAHLIQVHMELGQLSQARAILEEALAESPDSPILLPLKYQLE